MIKQVGVNARSDRSNNRRDRGIGDHMVVGFRRCRFATLGRVQSAVMPSACLNAPSQGSK